MMNIIIKNEEIVYYLSFIYFIDFYFDFIMISIITKKKKNQLKKYSKY
jgi:hypothetical protein